MTIELRIVTLGPHSSRDLSMKKRSGVSVGRINCCLDEGMARTNVASMILVLSLGDVSSALWEDRTLRELHTPLHGDLRCVVYGATLGYQLTLRRRHVKNTSALN